MKTLGYYNGRYGEIEDMTIPMNDRVCWFGDGVYDACYARHYKIFTLDEHVDRFFRSASLLEMELPVTKEELSDLLREMVIKLDSDEQFVYWQATRGSGVRYHAFPDGKANLWIALTPRPIVDTFKKIRVTSTEDTRFLHCNIKTLNLIPACMAAERAKRLGCSETIFHRGSRVTECAHSNVSILKDGVFMSPPADELILAGIARKHLFLACERLGIPSKEEIFTMDELMDADEIIVSSAGSLGLQVESVDGIPVGGRAPELLMKIQNEVLGEFLAATE